jgi:hypothetical protein
MPDCRASLFANCAFLIRFDANSEIAAVRWTADRRVPQMPCSSLVCCAEHESETVVTGGMMNRF